jgi:hypothetical protein
MGTINYKGMLLEEFSSDKPVIFDSPRAALCWMNNGWQEGVCEYILAFIPRSDSCLVVTDHSSWLHCALLPEKPEPRRATNRELAKWLAQGKGEAKSSPAGRIVASIAYEGGVEDKRVCNSFSVRKWDDTEWHEPTAEYLDLEDRV